MRTFPAASRVLPKSKFLWTVLFGLVAAIVAFGALAGGFRAGQKPSGNSSVVGPDPTQPIAKQRVRQSKWGPEESGVIDGATVQKDLVTGQVRRLRGEIAVPGAQSPRDASERFLRAQAAVFGLSPAGTELRHTREIKSLTGYHEVYDQVYAGYPVIGGRLSVHLSFDLSVKLVNSDLVPIKQPGAIATHGTSERAVQAAVRKVNAPVKPGTSPAATAAVTVIGGRPVAVWKVTFLTNQPPADWEALVDARTLVVLSLRNVAKYVDGQGMAFLPNPVNTSGNAALADNDDADSTALNSQRTSVVLKALDGTGRLQGPYATTEPTSAQPRANEPSNIFNYTRNDDRFEEVMCYYHIDTIERYIQSLGFQNINNRSVGADPNAFSDDNSFYSPSTKTVSFGDGGVDDAEDADVIWHEMGHCIQDNQVPNFGSSEECGAMGEGFGDYWGGSYGAGKGPNSPQWDVFIAKWDATSYNPGNPAFLRVLNSTKMYPDDMDGEVHDDGEIWSACLWQIWQLEGKTRADTMILEAHFSLSPDSTFEDGALAILAANQTLYNGTDQALIRKIFVDRGILEVVQAPSNLVANLASFSQIDLTWSDNSSTETGFRIERRVNTDAWLPIAEVGSDVTNYSDTGRARDTTYTYRVRAFTGDGDSRYSNEASKATPVPTFKIGGTITKDGAGFTGTTVTAAATGNFVFKQAASPALGIPDNDSNGVEASMTVTEPGTIGYLKIGVDISHTYRGDLEITLIHPDGTAVLLKSKDGSDSVDDVITTYPDLTAPVATLNALAGKPMNGTWKLRIKDLFQTDTGTLNTWTLGFGYAGNFSRSASSAANGDYSVLGLQAATYTVTPTKTGEIFTPVSRSSTVGPDQSGVNFAVDTTTTVINSLTLTPNAVTAGSTSTGKITLNHAATTNGFKVNLTSSNVPVASTPASVTVADGATTATFIVNTGTVVNSTNVDISATPVGSSTVTKATLTVNPSNGTPPPGAPTGLTATGGAARVTLNWTATAGATSYSVKRSTTAGGSYSTVAAGLAVTNYVDMGLTNGVTYYYVVSASNAGGESPNSAEASATPQASLVSLSLNPTTVIGGATSTGTVTLDSPAPTAGAVVTLSANNAAVGVPASVTVPGGTTNVTFNVTTTPVAFGVTVTITGTYRSVSRSGQIRVQEVPPTPVLSSLTLNPNSIVGGSSGVTGTVSLTLPAPAGGAVVALSSNNPAASVPASVTITAGTTIATFTVTTSAVPSNTNATISGTYAGVTKTATLLVQAPVSNIVLIGLSLSAPNAPGGTNVTGTITLSGAAPAGGKVVTLASSNPAAASVPGTITVPAGANTATFTVTTHPVSASTTVSITATASGSTKTASLQVRMPYIYSMTFNPASTRGGTAGAGKITLSGPAPANGFVINLVSTNTTVATVQASITVPAGVTIVTFPVNTRPVTSNTAVNITATPAGDTRVSYATLIVTP